ncbi:hypothetical protein BC829DRAFT_71182 [Chytridium lagenaria]|nr:hypothetical protein BC829DRAFT_71182 [Chytridium lagenaria]
MPSQLSQLKRGPGTRLSPLGLLSSGTSSFSESIFGTSIGLGPGRQIQAGWENTRNTHAAANIALGKRLPPLRSNVIASFSEALGTEPNTFATKMLSGSRHVLFDTPEGAENLKNGRSTSPRPYSARRQNSGGVRAKTTFTSSRPQTTTDETRIHLKTQSRNQKNPGNNSIAQTEELSLSPVLGTKVHHSILKKKTTLK